MASFYFSKRLCRSALGVLICLFVLSLYVNFVAITSGMSDRENSKLILQCSESDAEVQLVVPTGKLRFKFKNKFGESLSNSEVDYGKLILVEDSGKPVALEVLHTEAYARIGGNSKYSKIRLILKGGAAPGESFVEINRSYEDF